jgi:hypothetical protein
MREKQPGRIRRWWARYRIWIILVLAIYLALMIALVLLAGGAQWKPFLYQIF